MKLILKTEEYTGCLVMQKGHNISPKRERLNRGELPKYKVDEHHETIIDRDTFDRVQEIMARRSAEIESRKKPDSPFAGLLRCGKCGRSVCGHRTPTSRRNGDSRFVTWRCVGKNNGGNCDCRDCHNDELFAAAESILGADAIGQGLDGVKGIQMYDEKLVFELRNGRKAAWRRK